MKNININKEVFTRVLKALVLTILVVGFSQLSLAQDYSGEYQIQVKATGQYLHVDGNNDKLLSTRYQPDDDFTLFIFEKQTDGSYKITVKATGNHLHEDGSNDKLLSTRYQPDDGFTRFILESQTDGSFRIKVQADGLYWHEDGSNDKLVSTRYQPNDDFTRFILVSNQSDQDSDGPVSLFPEQYTTVTAFTWLTEQSTNMNNREVTITHTYNDAASTIGPIAVRLRKVGTEESEKFGTTVTLLSNGTIPGLENNRLILEDQGIQADQGFEKQIKVLFNYENSFMQVRDGQLKLLLRDLTTFQNESYSKTDHFVGPFLESAKVSYGGAANNWGHPDISPLSQNNTGSYTQSTSIGLDLGVGFSGKQPSGSLGGSLSYSSSQGTSVFDIEFEQTTSNSAPIFLWEMGNYYENDASIQTYRNDPWRIVRKVAEQIPIEGNSVHTPPPLSRGSFQIATNTVYTKSLPNNWTETLSPALPEFKIRINYELTYRAVWTGPQNWSSDAAEFGHGFGFVFGLDPNMWSGETFRKWGTVKRVYKFPVEITIPADVINTLPPSNDE